jgi:hypothetical protein
VAPNIKEFTDTLFHLRNIDKTGHTDLFSKSLTIVGIGMSHPHSEEVQVTDEMLKAESGLPYGRPSLEHKILKGAAAALKAPRKSKISRGFI